MQKNRYDITLIGGGIVGLATALAVGRRAPGTRVLVLEKELSCATHQTGHNSGVIHSGVYYKPGSLKARLCLQGSEALVLFCQANGIPFQQCGKVIVATREEELPRLKELHRRGIANGVPGVTLIGPERLRELEPHAVGIQALHVPSAGIVDYRQVADAFARQIQDQGGTIQTGSRVFKALPTTDGWLLETSHGPVATDHLINCAGLYSDRLARMSQTSTTSTSHIIPFRGEYYELIPERSHLVRSLIYPVPDPRFPFLGVHFSRRIQGRVEAGPNAVLALHREGYRKSDVNGRDLLEMVAFPGFWKMAARYWKTGLEELYRSFSKPAFVRALQRLVPAIERGDLVPAGAGVRAQAVDPAGNLLDDFHLVQERGAIHVCNAPSPAATASIAIGEFIADAALKQFRICPIVGDFL